ncbi:hypothetical protein [Micromonospora psammae]|uniref:hypothetical protein n=1 Tax=Micromonospora sp. CPCC 205556 TaxID=3122398 RepID=UPI002FF2D234
MTSEGPHRPGQEPDQVPPGAGGPTPYGDRQTQDNGYGTPANPDLGWAPPPPANRPNPAWATAQDQPPTWGAAQVPQQGEPAQPGPWNPQAAPAQPAWAAQSDQPAAGWAGAGQPAGHGEPAQPTWTQTGQATPAWAQPDAGARGAARVPQADAPATNGWSTQDDSPAPGGWNPAAQQEQPAATNGWGSAQDDPARSGGWPAPPQDDPARSGGWQAGGAGQEQSDGGWNNAGQNQPATSGGWNTAAAQQEPSSGGWNTAAAQQEPSSGGWNTAAAQQEQQAPGGWGAAPVHQQEQQSADTGQQDDPARSGGWPTPAASPSDDAPRSAGRASVPVPQHEPAPAAWAQPEAGARGAAQVPQPDAGTPNGWSGTDDAARSGGWPAERPTQDDAAHQGGWPPAGQPDERQQQRWGAPEEPGTARWEAREEQQPADRWGNQSSRDDQPQGQEWPAAQEPAGAGSWHPASAPQQDDRPDAGGWTPPEQPARASASVSVPDGGSPAWATAAADNAPQWAGADRPVVPDAEPWAAEEVWGRAGTDSAQRSAGDAWEPQRAEEPPAYQPGPAPGISPANAVPLPPQEQRVPGASLAAAPPADYVPPAQFGGAAEHPANGRDGGGSPSAYESERPGAPSGWNPPEQPQSPAGPVVPAPRTSPESEGAGRAAVPAADGAEAGRASASASVPLASRVMPPTDQALRPGGAPAPQPRVYGRPAQPADEPVEEPADRRPEHDQRFDGQDRNGFDGQDRYPFDERPDGPRGYGGEAPSSAPPMSPAAPPPFPGAIPAFSDPTNNTRPMNGTRPHGPADRPAEPFGAPGSPAAGDPVPGYGHPAHDPAHGGGTSAFPSAGQPFPPAGPPFPPAGQQFPEPGGAQSGPASWPHDPDPDQGRFEAFKPEAEPKTEQPAPKVRNGRVLALVLIAAVLILAVPLGLLSLLGKIGGNDEPAPFNPAVGSCVKQSGGSASAANCGEQGAFTVVSRVAAKDKCADPAQPHVVLPGSGADRVLCLKPATK